MNRLASAACLMFFIMFPLFAEDTFQTDWSGGPGVQGPVLQWESTFSEADDISWRSVAGQLCLSSRSISPTVKSYIDRSFHGGITIHADDVDEDGDMDVMAAGEFDHEIRLWLNNGDGSSWTEDIIADAYETAISVHTGDIDGDGMIDIVGASYEADEIAWWRNGGGVPIEWNRFIVDVSFDGVHDVQAVDVDGDGDLDLLGAACLADEISWWRNNGGDPITWTRFDIDENFDYACRLRGADFNNDGRMDIVATAWLDEEVAWYQNDGGDPVRWTKHILISSFTGTHSVCAADLDDDGRTDILAAAMDLGDIRWWRNIGGDPIEWESHLVDGAFAGAICVQAGDMDGDGDLDVIGSAWSTMGISWWENVNGDAMQWTEHAVTRNFGATPNTYPADINGDGALDLLGVSWDLNDAAWWEVSEFENQGWLTSSILDMEHAEHYSSMSWSSGIPEETGMAVQIRSSDDTSDLGEWSEEYTDTFTIPQPMGRYIQYRVSLFTESADVSPIVYDIGLSEEPHSVFPESLVEKVQMVEIYPNPCRDRLSLKANINLFDALNVSLYDVGGRRISTWKGIPESGTLPITDFVGLNPGSYLCRIKGPAVDEVHRIIVNK